MFAGYYSFVKFRDSNLDDEKNVEELKQMIRITSNLIGRNNRSDEENNARNIKKLESIAESGDSILNNEHLEEEDKDSNALFAVEGWETLVYKAEKHPLSSGTASWLIRASEGDYVLAKEYLYQTFESEHSIFTQTDIRSLEYITKLWSYDEKVRNGIKIALGNSPHSSTYSWWSYLHQESAGAGIKRLIDSGFSYNDRENLKNDLGNYREWFMAVPEILDNFRTFGSGNRDYILERQHNRMQGRKYQLQLVALKDFITDIELEVIHNNSQREDFFAKIRGFDYFIRYKGGHNKEGHFHISKMNEEPFFNDTGNSVIKKLEQTKKKIIELSL